MLDSWIIEEIRRREEDKRRQERPVIEMPQHEPDPVGPLEEKGKPEDDTPRGVAVIDL